MDKQTVFEGLRKVVPGAHVLFVKMMKILLEAGADEQGIIEQLNCAAVGMALGGIDDSWEFLPLSKIHFKNYCISLSMNADRRQLKFEITELPPFEEMQDLMGQMLEEVKAAVEAVRETHLDTLSPAFLKDQFQDPAMFDKIFPASQTRH